MISSVLEVLERGLAYGDRSLRSVMLLSFLESLPKQLDEQELRALRALFGPNMRRGLEAAEHWLNQPWFKTNGQPYEWFVWKPVHRDDTTES